MTTLDAETRQLLKLAVSNRRREETPYVEPRYEPKHYRAGDGDGDSPGVTPAVNVYAEEVAAMENLVETQEAELRSLAERLADAAERFGLTLRETEVLAFACEGLRDPEIGARLYVSTETVRTHMKRILAKTGARNRTHAAVLAVSGNSPPPGMDHPEPSA